ncbi:MAG TPA: hypothetical protein VK129_03635, partial [Terriglobales bacterium]|nr:hypothetical protein [Terriglobales bacterium]
FFVVQEPPGAHNWCIGCIGTKVTATEAGSGKTVPNGIYESLGTKVTPNSLYLAQLCDRLGPAALTNIGYSSSGCTVAVPGFSLSSSPTSRTITAGNSTTYAITVTPSNGFSGTVALSVSGLPAGAGGSFSPASVSGSGTSTLTVTTSATNTPQGTYILTITGTSGSLSSSTTVTLGVNMPPPPDFSLTASPSSQTVTAGSGTSYTVTVGALNGFSGSVALSTGSLPAGVTASFNPASVTGSGTSTLNVSTSATAASGPITITGTSGSLSHSTTVNLTVNPANVCTTATANGAWLNTAFPSHSGTFTATFDATPSLSLQGSTVGISKGAQTANTGFANIVAFSATGIIQARNGGSYFDSTIHYSGGISYHFRLVINVTAHTYSVFVTPAGGSEQTVGTGFLFRTEQNTVTSLDHWGAKVNTTPGGTLKVCNFTAQ